MFYVYLHCRPDGTPFYVGKGTRGRARQMSFRNPHHTSIIAKHGAANIVVKLFPVASEAEAFALECRKIAELRAAGIRLANQTDGGEGAAGRPASERVRLAFRHKGETLSASHREKLSASLTGRVVSDETREKLRQNMLGKIRPHHVHAALLAANKGRPLSPEHKAQAVEALRKAQEAAKEWHASEEGRAWHAEHGKATWANRVWHPVQCIECGRGFQTPYPNRAKFCDSSCRDIAKRRRMGQKVGTRAYRKKTFPLLGKRAPDEK